MAKLFLSKSLRAEIGMSVFDLFVYELTIWRYRFSFRGLGLLWCWLRCFPREIRQVFWVGDWHGVLLWVRIIGLVISHWARGARSRAHSLAV